MADWVTPASYGQERLWLAAGAAPGTPLYHVEADVALPFPLEREQVRDILAALAARHEILRTALRWYDGLMQVVRPAVEPRVAWLDLTEAAAAERARSLAQARAANLREVLDPAEAPLWRVLAVRQSTSDWLLLFVLHHAVFDAASHEVLSAELAELAAAAVAGRAPCLPELPIQYADFAAWQRAEATGGALAGALAYWRERLAGIPAGHGVPTDRPRPAQLGFAGDEVRFNLDADLVGAVGALARQLGATPAGVLLAAYAALIARLSTQDDVVVGVPASQRDRPELAGLIGMFVNTLVVRVDAGGRPSFAELVGRVQAALAGALDHRQAPFQLVVEAVAPRRDASAPPLYQLGFNYTPSTGTDASHGTARADLLLELAHTNGRLEYSTELFTAASATAIARRYLRLLAGLVADPHARCTEPSLLDDGEAERLGRWSRGEIAAYPPGATVPGLVRAQARRTPDAIAVCGPDGALTYAQLDARAGALARRLVAAGAGPESLVPVCVPRGLDLVVALLGVLKAGAAYVPLDPDHPAPRLAQLLADSGAEIAVAAPELAELVAGVRHAVLVGADDATGAETEDRPVPDTATAYVIYTSGSTGAPKGVPNEHRAVVNRLLWMQDQFGLGPDDVVLQKTPVGFDVSVWELFWPLITGARLVLAAPGGHQDPGYLRRLIEDAGVTTVHFVPSLLAVFLDEAVAPVPAGPPCPSLRRVICSGEALPVDLAARCLRMLPARLWNLYGPTEAAIDVSVWECRAEDLAGAARVPIGRPIHNLALYVLDGALRPVPTGVAGELCIGGAGVARGYHRRPGLTARQFVPDPFGPPGARLYRTGDLARWRDDGALDFLGRRDRQVKLHGQRVELAEIEVALREQPGVREAAVTVLEPGSHLAAFIVGDADPAAVRAALSARLPRHLVPATLTPLPALPLGPTGKLDRSALPAPAAVPATSPPGRPRTPTEELVAGVWAAVFDRPAGAIGRDDDFFDLGGHSLLATRIAARLGAATGAEVSMRAAFAHPTVAALAQHVDGLLGAAGRHEPIPVRAGEETDLPLTFAQERLWFLHRMDPTDPQFSVPIARRLRGPLDEAALAGAVAAAVARHAPLRTRFAERDGRPVQIVLAGAQPRWRRHDVAGPGACERAAALVAELVAEPFDLAQAPLLRVDLIRLADDDHVLLLLTHHLVSDGWSMKLLLDELAAGYAAARAGTSNPPGGLALSYGDFALWQRDAGPDAAGLEHWVARLRGAPALELPTDHPRPPVRSSRGGTVECGLGPDLTAGLDRLALAQRCTPFMVLLAAYQAALGAWAGQDDFCVGSPVAGRDRAELEPLIGLFTNTVVLRADLSGAPTFAQLLARVRRTALDAYVHQDVPFEPLMNALSVPRDPSRTPVFQVLFTLHSQGSGEVAWPGLTVGGFADGAHAARCDLALEAWRADGPAGEELRLRFVWAAELFEAATIEAFGRRLTALLAAVADDPDLRPSDVDLITPAERAWLLAQATGAAAAPPPIVPAAVAARIAADPDRPAVRHGDTTISYGELGRRAAGLASVLRGHGAGRDTVVAVCVEPGPDLVVALLGVWWAGAAYLPLGPDYPARRLGYLVADGGARIVVTTRAVTARGTLPPVPQVTVDDLAPAAVAVPAPVADPGDLAYVLYTSGSTGAPKGVAVSHAALAARVGWMRDAYGLRPDDRVLQFAAVTFDTHAEELYPALCAGATVVVPATAATALPELLASPGGRDLTVLDLPTPYWHELVAREPAVAWPEPLRLVILGADQARADAVRRWHELTGGRVTLLNTYGPTEATIVATAARLVPEQAGRPPIGRPLAQTTATVVDARGRLAPPGVPGELVLGGAGLARGYHGRPGLTAARFVPDPYGPAGSRRYRTGDRARVRADGQLEFLGRTDGQVKVRGYRIETGEVEAFLTEHPAVAQAAVIARDDALVGYLVPAPGARLDADEVRAHLAAAVPAHLVPGLLVVLDRLPLTEHGKLDRAALPAPQRSESAGATPPRTDAERLVAAVWSDVLGVARIGVDDDFFALGGHSLIATRVLARLSASVELEIPVATIFTHPTVARLAAEVERLLIAEVEALTEDEAQRLLGADGGRAR